MTRIARPVSAFCRLRTTRAVPCSAQSTLLRPTPGMADTANAPRPKREANWPGVLLQLYTTSVLLYGFHFIRQSYLSTVLFEVVLILAGLLGVTAGAHRLWAHRSYGASTPLRTLLMLCQTLTLTGPIYDWVLDHRIHHKHHGTDDDPYNYKRGFFYAHVGHTMQGASPRRELLAKEIDMSDIEADGIVMFQRKFYWVLAPVIALLLPINAPVEYWGESILNSLMVVGLQRISISFHLSYLINSAQTIWGLTPGDRFFSDSNWVYVIRKSHWHAYHYTVPWDYLTNEFGSYNCGCTTTFIKLWATVGWAYGLRTVDAWGVRRALEAHVDTNKPLAECIADLEEEVRERLPEDHYLLDRTNWPKH